MKEKIIVLFSAILGLFCLGTNPISQSMRCVDEMVFLYVGDAMRRGLMPYRDVFDHKGPLLYIINEIGLSISNGATWGVWLIEGVLLVLGCIVLIRWARRIGVGSCAATAMLLYLVFVFISICGGNICETYALFFVVCALASGLAPLITGFSIAGLIMVKFTLAFPLAVAFLSVNLKWRRIFLCSIVSCMGLVPFVVWMMANHFLGDFWDVYIMFNAVYGKATRSGGVFIVRVMPAILLTVWVCGLKMKEAVWNHKTDFRNLDFTQRSWIGSLVYVLSCFAMLFAMGVQEEYYFIPVLPGCFLPLALACGRLWDRKVWVNRAFVVFCFVFLAFLVFRANVYVTPYVKAIVAGVPLVDVMRSVRKAGFDETLAFRDKIENRDSVTVLGNICAIYRVLDVRTPWRYPYQRPISYIDKRIFEDVCRELRAKSSRYLIYAKWDVEIMNMFKEHWEMSYRKMAETDNFVLLTARE